MGRPKLGMVNPRTGDKIANQHFEAIPSLPGALSKKPAAKKGKKKTGGFGVK